MPVFLEQILEARMETMGERGEMTYNSGLQLDLNQGHCNYTVSVLNPQATMMPWVAFPTESDLQYVVGREDSSQHSREVGTSVAFLPARKSSDRKTALTAHRNSSSHSQHPFLVPSFKTTLSLFVIHSRAKPQY